VRSNGTDRRRDGTLHALAAAALFGSSPPLAKLLLPELPPVPLAGLLYLGAGVGLTAFGLVRRGARGVTREARLRTADYGLVAAIIVLGGVSSPIFMLAGLQRASGVVVSLLLNLEAPFTILLAVTLFGEHLGRRELGGAALVIAGAALLAFVPGRLDAGLAGVACVVAACLGWAIDNNLTQRLSLRDPVAVARAKTLGAAVVGIGLAAILGRLPAVSGRLGLALLLGFVSYGVSVVLAIEALRRLGAAREAALFATAPFVGAAVSVPLLGEAIGLRELVASAIMAIGVLVLFREEHAHPHAHDWLEHEHAHVHDAHHQHDHAGAADEPHAHPHVHPPLVHAHPHVSDAHHRHRHKT
jgi:drug/metabolite transporter (DMT)-like permease